MFTIVAINCECVSLSKLARDSHEPKINNEHTFYVVLILCGTHFMWYQVQLGILDDPEKQGKPWVVLPFME